MYSSVFAYGRVWLHCFECVFVCLCVCVCAHAYVNAPTYIRTCKCTYVQFVFNTMCIYVRMYYIQHIEFNYALFPMKPLLAVGTVGLASESHSLRLDHRYYYVLVQESY